MDHYVPNNPNFGCEPVAGAGWQPLSPPRPRYTPSPEPPDPGPLPGTLPPEQLPLHTCHTTDPMINGLTFNALDLEPLPHVHTISQHREFSPPPREKTPSQDMNDFFFSMKHHGASAGPASPSASGHLQVHQFPLPGALPGTNHHGFVGPTNQLPSLFGPGGHAGESGAQMFPSMSVNVSMNMNIGVSATGYQLPEEAFTPQLWNSPSQYQSGGIFSPQPPLVSPLSMAASCSAAQYSQSASYSLAPDACGDAGWQGGERSQQLTASWRARRRPGLGSVEPLPPSGYPTHLDPALLYVCKTESPTLGLDKTNICRVCGKAYARPSTLKTHMRTHSGERPYKCHECNKSFSQAANLTAHVRTHSGEKPFCCPICDRRFSQSSSVTTHMRTHSGDRPYRCRMCKKSFSDSSTLTKHMRIHSGEKPYQCRICMLRFSQSGNLNRHMRVHASNMC